MKNMLSLLFFRIAIALHGPCKKANLWVNSPVYTPDGKRTGKYSRRTCRLCGDFEDFPWNHRQYGYTQTAKQGEFCELCGGKQKLVAGAWGSVGQITVSCAKCRESAAVPA